MVYRCLFLLALLFATAGDLKSQLNIADSRCDHKEVPFGVDTSAPVFSWRMVSPVRGDRQTSYRIIVSDSEDLIARDIGNMWDSGQVVSDESIGVRYAGNPLKSFGRYYWKVCVWDRNGDLSEWGEPHLLQMGLLQQSDWEGAEWIAMEVKDADAYEKGDSGRKEPRMPQFRKLFKIKETPVESAVVYISGLGSFVLSVNGDKVGNNFLDPAWSRYDKSAQYVTFDLTDMIRPGDNVIGVRLGNGFLHIPDDKSRYYKLLTDYAFPMLRSKLIINYKDGTKDVVDSDSSWKVAPSPVVFSSIYGGEDYDARLELHGWNLTGFDDSGWQDALVARNDAEMRSQKSPPLGVRQRFSPVKIHESQDGVYIYDFGQNAAGIVEIKVKGPVGAKIDMRPCEYLTDEGLANQNNSGLNYIFSYTLGGDSVERWSPDFSYYGFRFVELRGGVPEGFPNPDSLPVVENLEMLHVSNASERVGKFSCSDKMFNDIYSLIDWSVRSNMSHVMTDCPHREKLGWLEVPHLMSHSIAYNFDIQLMFSGLMDQMKESMHENGLVPNIAPEYAIFPDDFSDSPEWGSSAVILPYFIYKWYGDRSVIEQYYPLMVAYVDYLKSRAEDNILYHGLGDWYDLGPEHPGYSQLTVRGLTPTAVYYQDLSIMAEVAGLLGKEDDAARYGALAKDVKAAFNEKFFNKEKGYYDRGSQTANAMPLYLNLVDEPHRENCIRQIVNDIRMRENSITSGDVGFSYLVRTLMQEGESQLVYDMNHQSERPGYGYQLKQGATSLTESWEALKTASHNHCMLGHLMEWLYGSVGGIRQGAESVAFKDFIVCPEPVGDIRSADVEFRSPYGLIKSEWKDTDSDFTAEVAVPVGSKARIYLPASDCDAVLESGQPALLQPGVRYIGKEKNKSVFEIESGSYTFKVNK